ncbi:MAG: cation:proton antiporter [Gloeomargarita sp. GMQP_bins_25]
MNTGTILWLGGAFFLAFLTYLLPGLARFFSVLGAAGSLGYGVALLGGQAPVSLHLLDHFGVSLLLDEQAAFFVLTNALVTLAVTFATWNTQTPFFCAQLLILHGSLNVAFAVTDGVSLYVALEVVAIAAFLLMTITGQERLIWVGLRYLFVSNVAMLFYLVGAVLVYEAQGSFAWQGLRGAPPEAKALLVLGLLVKGGVFLLGFWLPMTHAEVAAPVSALLSGVVVKAPLLALVRMGGVAPELEALVRGVGVATAGVGGGGALGERDVKRLLAWSTMSQLGFVLAAPAVGGFYALTHGLSKAALFLAAGRLPSRELPQLQSQGVDWGVALPLALAGLSVCGLPGLAGYGAKTLTMQHLWSWQGGALTAAAVGTAMVYGQVLFLPWRRGEGLPWGYGLGLGVLIGGLLLANGWYVGAFTWEELGKAWLTIALGWGLYWGISRRWTVPWPRTGEQLEHLLGMMSLGLVAVFSWVWLWSERSCCG